MLALLKPFWLQIVKYGSILIGILFVLFKVRQSGKEAVEAKDANQSLKDIRTRDEIEDNISGLSNDKLDKLRGKWER